MNIDETVKELKIEFVGDSTNQREAKDLAIDIMRKYQKIAEIVAKWHNDPRMKMTTSYYYMAKITEVLEDGKID